MRRSTPRAAGSDRRPSRSRGAKAKALDHLWVSRLEAWRLARSCRCLEGVSGPHGRNRPGHQGQGRRVAFPRRVAGARGAVERARWAAGHATTIARLPKSTPAGGDRIPATSVRGPAAHSGRRRRREASPRHPQQQPRQHRPGPDPVGRPDRRGGPALRELRLARSRGPSLGKNLLAYHAKGVDTVEQIIGRWAPASENPDLGDYVKTVAKKLGVDPREPLNLKDRKVLTSLATAIIEHENGRTRTRPRPSARGSIPRQRQALRLRGETLARLCHRLGREHDRFGDPERRHRPSGDRPASAGPEARRLPDRAHAGEPGHVAGPGGDEAGSSTPRPPTSADWMRRTRRPALS
jgi:hypothetical protein